MNYLINIIIPCYYSSKIITPCFESLANQTNKNFMVTMINDCSPNTDCEYLDIRQKYSKYFYLEYYKTEVNSGPGVARQIGLNYNNCPYIMFIDDDDLIYPTAIEIFINAILNEPNPVFIYGDYAQINNNKTSIFPTRGIWGKIFNNNIIQQNNINFGILRLEEDGLFMEKYWLVSQRYFKSLTLKSKNIYIPKLIYYYSYNKDSITHTADEKQCNQAQFDYAIDFIKFLLQQPEDIYTKNTIYRRIKNLSEIIFNQCLNDENIFQTYPLYELIKKYNIPNLKINTINNSYQTLKQYCIYYEERNEVDV